MKYTDTHEWIQIEKEIGIVGITQHAQKELGDIVFVELPKVGKTVQKGKEAAVLESTKAAADIYSPVSGEILEVNSQLSQSPQLINQSPETEGWIFKIRLSNLAEVEKLMDQKAYEGLIQGAN
jgi:glycine cleavage system H protein